MVGWWALFDMDGGRFGVEEGGRGSAEESSAYVIFSVLAYNHYPCMLLGSLTIPLECRLQS